MGRVWGAIRAEARAGVRDLNRPTAISLLADVVGNSAMTIFDQRSGRDPIYVAHANPKTDMQRIAREHVLDLWAEFKHFADDDFVSAICDAFHDRYWEMYLGVSLVKFGYKLKAPKPGPDFGIEFHGKTVWIEATCPTAGAPGNLNSISEPEPGKGYSVPNESILLRYLSSIEQKMTRQYLTWLNRGQVSEDDCFVLALNPSKIPFDSADSHPPRIIQAAFPVGYQTVRINTSDGSIVDSGYEHRTHIAKASGTEIATGAFETHSQLSALLCSRVDVVNHHCDFGADFQTVLNPFCVNAIPVDFTFPGHTYPVSVKGHYVSVELARSPHQRLET